MAGLVRFISERRRGKAKGLDDGWKASQATGYILPLYHALTRVPLNSNGFDNISISNVVGNLTLIQTEVESQKLIGSDHFPFVR